MAYFQFNGSVLPSGTPIIAPPHSGLYYGDGLFETLYAANGKLRWLALHWERLQHGLDLLNLSLPAYLTLQYVEEAALSLMQKNTVDAARVRLTITANRNKSDSTADWILEALPAPEFNPDEPAQEVTLAMLESVHVPLSMLAGIKSNNFLHYHLAAMKCKELQVDDAALLNNKGELCDTTIANVFFKTGNIWHTPALTSGCVNGVLRKKLIEFLQLKKIPVTEGNYAFRDLQHAVEIMLTNSLRGIRVVNVCEGRKLSTSEGQQIHHNFWQAHRSAN